MTVVATRSRTARRRSTPLALLGQSVVVAASSGLAFTMAAPGAVAAPVPADPQADVKVTPSVSVPEDAEWSIATSEVKAERPAPVVRRATATATRSYSRVAPPASATASAVVNIAFRYVGTPYVYGGATPAGFDCSGFTQYVYAQVGVSLPRSSSAQRYAGTVVPASEARAGDLVWWPGHVGIYLGDGQHIAARRPGVPLQAGPIYGSNPVFIRVL